MKNKNSQFFRCADVMLTLQGALKKRGRRVTEADLGLLRRASMWVEDGQIVWIGEDQKLPKRFLQKKAKEISLKGSTVLPGFVECHTHSVFVGSRAHEFELRQQGVSYSDISKQGGGILSTVRKVRQALPVDLLRQAQEKVERFCAQGVTTLEVKSGYGLDLKSEIKMLEVIKKIKGPRVVSTFLGAHARPPEFASCEDYLNALTHKFLPVIAERKLAERVDIFVEKGFFESSSAKSYLKKAQKLGFHLTVHADQLSLSGGTQIALELNAQSADHVICIDQKTIQRLGHKSVTAVLLPAADFYMKCAYPPARELIDAGATVALATDFNPGTSPTLDLNFVGLLARVQMKMTLPEVIAAYTVGAAYALGRQQVCGALAQKMSADFICTAKEWTDLFYEVGASDISRTYLAGKKLYERRY